MKPNNIPEELKRLKRWHNWKIVNGSKVPIQPGGGMAKSNDPSTWHSFDDAKSTGDGLAFELGDGYCGIDLDNCLDENGKLREWAVPIVASLVGVAYGEISPSGSGIKFITKAVKPEECRCVHQFGGDKQQIECYDKARFWAMTGWVWENFTDLGDGQEAIDKLCKEYLAAEQKTVGRMEQPSIASGGQTVFQRGLEYIANAQPAGQGDRNNACFRLAGHLRAIVDEDGQRISETDLLDLLLRWNAENVPPLPEREVKQVMASSARNGTPPPDKPPGQSSRLDTSGVDFSKIMEEALGKSDGDWIGLEKDEISSEEEKPPVPESLLSVPGFVNDVIEYTMATAHYPNRTLAFQGAMALQATLAGRKAEFGDIRPALYFISLAGTGVGKEAPRATNNRILDAVGFAGVLDAVGSGEGLEDAISQHPNAFLMVDEVDAMIADMGRKLGFNDGPGAGILRMLLTLFSASTKGGTHRTRALSKTEARRICEPNLNLLGATTPRVFFESLSMKLVDGGFLPRTIILDVGRRGELNTGAREALARGLPDKIREHAQAWIDLDTTGAGNLQEVSPASYPASIREQEQFNASPAAIEALDRFALECDQRYRAAEGKEGSDIALAMWSRAMQKAERLALIHAISGHNPAAGRQGVLTEDAVEWAAMFVRIQTERLLFLAEGEILHTDYSPSLKRALKHIARGGEKGITRTQFYRGMQMKARDCDEIIGTLFKSGQIELCEQSFPGQKRPTVMYRVVE